eukprot:COSAG06_NODE_2141_length_7492_cov_2.079399_6_plen_62_part_00
MGTPRVVEAVVAAGGAVAEEEVAVDPNGGATIGGTKMTMAATVATLLISTRPHSQLIRTAS